MTHPTDLRVFSEEKYKKGGWRTRVSRTRNPLIRAAWSLLSLKRQYVGQLASHVDKDALGLELGCGVGAYTHWFLGRKPCSVVATDWSTEALGLIQAQKKGTLLRVCADARFLPFKQDSFSFFFSVDTLGHVSECEMVLDELLRTTKSEAPFFVHSECADYREKWPDRSLIKKLGSDLPAESDGHVGLKSSDELYQAFSRRFALNRFFSPAGVLGWLMGYPDKYFEAFRKAHWYALLPLLALCIAIKKTPLAGVALRLTNTMINRLEIFLGITGGGSCFAFGTKRGRTSKN